ncbi:MAG: aldo/keto reductase [Oscillospiraceae bacterium]|nr:aldo/keto reductase [Oscillospiraceae bacterium]
METRFMRTTGIDMPLLGMGLMRVPLNPDGTGDEEQSLAMVETMYNAGVRYFDTAYVYIGGESERFAKRALTDKYPRDSFYLASKLPLESVKQEGDMERIFGESCSRMGVDYIDFYLLHGINYEGWELAKKLGADKFQQELKAAGRIKYAGFSFHGSVDCIKKILSEKSDWDFIQLQLNYYDAAADDAMEFYNIVSSYDIPIVVMEPVRGGALARGGDEIESILRAARPDDSPARWAMRWVGSLPKVSVVLSGVSDLPQARENANVYSPLEPITPEEQVTLDKVTAMINSRPFVPCTKCCYCGRPCPAGVYIADVFEAANEITRLGNVGSADWQYNTYLKDGQRADSCIGCGECIPKCPQGIDIPSELARVHVLITDAIAKM